MDLQMERSRRLQFGSNTLKMLKVEQDEATRMYTNQ